MKKLILGAISALFLAGCSNNSLNMANPWVECNQDFICAKNKAGFNFPLVLSNYTIRAMKDMVEITYPLDEIRYVTVRKAQTQEGDISGVYNKYPKNEKLKLKSGVEIDTRGDENKIYVMYFGAESGIYSAFCKEGMTKKEVQGIFDIIEEAESPKY